MTVWAIADIHASPPDADGNLQKPMEVFGEDWANHVDRIEEAWLDRVLPDDTVLVAGDLEWSMKLDDAISTLQRVGSWPGHKLLIRGNHDYWWSSDTTNKVRRVLPPSIELLFNNAIHAEGFEIVGCKGSPVPGGPEWTPQDDKLLKREVGRLKMALAERKTELPTIVVMHYPPFYPSDADRMEDIPDRSAFLDVFRESDVIACVYGHLHGESAALGPHGKIDGVTYILAAADYTRFKPIPVGRDGYLI